MEITFTVSVNVSTYLLKLLKEKIFSNYYEFCDFIYQYYKLENDSYYAMVAIDTDEFYEKVWEWYQKNRKTP